MPGPRREEVSVPAATSTDYHTRVEQGRLQPSVPLLSELVRVLRLSEDQRAHLFELAAKSVPHRGSDRRQVHPQLQRMLDDLTNTLAFVIGRRTEVVGWSRPATALFADFGRFPEPERLYLRLLITEPAVRRLYADCEEVTRPAIAQLRMESARHPDDPRLAALVDELSVRDGQFRQWWAAHDVALRTTATKRLHHTVVVERTLDWHTLTCATATATATDTAQHIIVWTARPNTPSNDGHPLP
ncbi:MmyB family transcriptional regulator [Streptomyces guryensis]|uniref:MmyB family transcriptional regulator n=1 Tax=Streptomyces guryensis TaxID=2886947 RepID=UPI0027DF36DE|nr:helix-turn-helix domain-containing protein [Streptomyces guryensis]